MKVSELFDVSGYGVIVTGGASGIGLGYVEALAGNGARVTLLDHDAGRVSEETGRLQAAGLDVQGRVVDVTDHPALDAAFDESAARYGRLDVVFANAGIDSGPGFLGNWFGTDRGRPAEGAAAGETRVEGSLRTRGRAAARVTEEHASAARFDLLRARVRRRQLP